MEIELCDAFIDMFDVIFFYLVCIESFGTIAAPVGVERWDLTDLRKFEAKRILSLTACPVHP
ncbi:hypothetical protein BCAR13_410034 [Paraburkholderia caribensis]|nr:hypothetical protein BCAR13_410034 [Paraburkholderia caribensis]